MWNLREGPGVLEGSLACLVAKAANSGRLAITTGVWGCDYTGVSLFDIIAPRDKLIFLAHTVSALLCRTVDIPDASIFGELAVCALVEFIKRQVKDDLYGDKEDLKAVLGEENKDAIVMDKPWVKLVLAAFRDAFPEGVDELNLQEDSVWTDWSVALTTMFSDVLPPAPRRQLYVRPPWIVSKDLCAVLKGTDRSIMKGVKVKVHEFLLLRIPKTTPEELHLCDILLSVIDWESDKNLVPETFSEVWDQLNDAFSAAASLNYRREYLDKKTESLETSYKASALYYNKLRTGCVGKNSMYDEEALNRKYKTPFDMIRLNHHKDRTRTIGKELREVALERAELVERVQDELREAMKQSRASVGWQKAWRADKGQVPDYSSRIDALLKNRYLVRHQSLLDQCSVLFQKLKDNPSKLPAIDEVQKRRLKDVLDVINDMSAPPDNELTDTQLLARRIRLLDVWT
eukprot:Rmarinus@m.13581